MIACPKCGSRFLRPSRTKKVAEQFLFLRLKTALRCLDCKTRFIAPLFDWENMPYARCPVCRRMDLNGWTGKTYTNPPFLIKLKVTFGAKKWRCEYCRLNFASFRRRKEVFTFKRWKRFVPQAEEAPAKAEKVEFIARPYLNHPANAGMAERMAAAEAQQEPEGSSSDTTAETRAE